ncbi:MetQ/NlpA family ABC transporter substrate-binding protein [Plantibacter sp. YIM 135249]|uniref:MetQ/NlpA family ABC transporter substrate-binding protein n=1 Tax=Plantibacter sp. YIM 135249 TaxID=3423918 RepID=UPI003D3268C7
MSNDSPAPVLPEKARTGRRGLVIGIAVAVVVVIVAAVLIIPNLFKGTSDDAAAAGKPVTVKLGVVDAGKSFWDIVVKRAKEDGINLEIVSFSDYTTPNPALTNGDIDINKFQHVRYLAQYDASQREDLVPIGASEIYPIGFYSKKWTSVADIPQGAEVTLSNNPANQVRPLLALEAAGLVTLKGDPGWNATLDDVDYTKSRIGTITPIDPTQTAASLDSVDIAFVDSNFAQAAGLTVEQKIYEEDADRDDLGQYINIFAVRAKDADNAALTKIVEIYQSDEVKKAIQAEDGFEGIFKDTSVKELNSILEQQKKQF